MQAPDSFDEKLKAFDEAELMAMLRLIERRLGTGGEEVPDLGRAQAIAHRLNNLRTGKSMLRLRDFSFP